MTPPLKSFTSGFGAVISAEKTLREELRSFTPHRIPIGLFSIFQHQAAQVDMIIGLLERRDQLLPQPQRFAALSGCVRPGSKVLSPVASPHHGSLGSVIMAHETLRHGIESLIEQSGHHDRNEISLHEAAQRHAEMEWMLTALRNEEVTKDRTPEVGAAQGVWENEGGGNPPHSITRNPGSEASCFLHKTGADSTV